MCVNLDRHLKVEYLCNDRLLRCLKPLIAARISQFETKFLAKDSFPCHWHGPGPHCGNITLVKGCVWPLNMRIIAQQTMMNLQLSGWEIGVNCVRYMCTATIAQVVASLLKATSLAVCVRISCSGLMITSLLQVVNRFDASWLLRHFIHKLDASFFFNNKPCSLRSHRLLLLDDNKPATSCQQAWCKLIVKTFYYYSQPWCKLFRNLAASLRMSSFIMSVTFVAVSLFVSHLVIDKCVS